MTIAAVENTELLKFVGTFWQEPLNFVGYYWPDLHLYDKQIEILYSLRDNDETVVRAGNGLGKDFIAGLATLWFFGSRTPARVVTTSVDGSQLDHVLWGEIRRFIQTANNTLPFLVNHQLIRQVVGGKVVPLCEVAARVARKGEGLLGRHLPRDIPRTLVVFDEASGNEDTSYDSTVTWSHRRLVIGNPFPCTNFFRRACREGDIESPQKGRYYRKVMRITCEDSPNVRRGRFLKRKYPKKSWAEIEQLVQKPKGKWSPIPGLISIEEVEKRRKLMPKILQTISLDAEFYEGAENLLYPPDWMAKAGRIAKDLKGRRRTAQTMGVDCAEGGDNTSWTIVDKFGVIYQKSIKTEDTADIPGITAALIREYNLEPGNVLFDAGGGGKQIVQAMRRQDSKWNDVRIVPFGGAASDPSQFKRMRTSLQKEQAAETRFIYVNRRAEMYGLLRELMHPEYSEHGFGIPEEYDRLWWQLSQMPYLLTDEGRMYLPPKNKKPNSNVETIKEIVGCSPDEADSLVLAVYGLFSKGTRAVAGGAW